MLRLLLFCCLTPSLSPRFSFSRRMCFLEVNLSCNFFRGKFDEEEYWAYLLEGFDKLDLMRRKND
jgi:hypothetical protein